MERRSSIFGGTILILVGLLFLALQMFPGLASQLDIARHWPLIIVGVGGLFLLGALLGTAPLAVPGSIIGGIGTLLYYQNLTGHWASWAYAWTLIPGFVGIGTFLMYLLQGRIGRGFSEGGRLIIISLVLFVIFGSFLGGWVTISTFWPLLLIFLGLWLLLRSTFRRPRRQKEGEH